MNPAPIRPALRNSLLAGAVAAGLTLVIAAPVLLAPGERLFGREIVGRHNAPFVVIQQFEGSGASGPYLQPMTDIPGRLLTRILGSGVLALNAMVLSTFALAACFAYLLAFHLTASPTVAWLTALVYAFLPYHVAQAAYHPHGAQTQWLPLYLLALFLNLDRPRPSAWILLAVATGLVTLSNFYYGLMAAVLTPVAFVAYWLVARRTEPRTDRAALQTGGALAALAAGGLAFILLRAPQVIQSPTDLAFPRRHLTAFSARWWSYWLPPVDHPLAGDVARGVWRARGTGGLLEQQITIGFGLTLLAAVAVVVWLRGDRGRLTRPVPVLAAIAVAAFALSLPPDWRFGPSTLRAPSGWLYEVLPMFRAYARFALVVALAVTILAAIGFVVLRRRSRTAARVAVGLLVVSLIEITPVPPWRWRDVLPTSAHRWLVSNVANPRLFDCLRPRHAVLTADSARYEGDITYRRGYLDCGDPQVAGLLADQGFGHLLVRRNSALGRWLPGHSALDGLVPVGDFEDALLFRLPSRPPEVLLEIGPGFHWREYKNDRTFRWMEGRGELSIRVGREPGPAPRRLELELHAFPQPRTVDVKVDGGTVAELSVATEPRRYRIQMPPLTPGRHRLELVSREPAVIADDLLHNGDQRSLAVALWDWEWGKALSDPPCSPDDSD